MLSVEMLTKVSNLWMEEHFEKKTTYLVFHMVHGDGGVGGGLCYHTQKKLSSCC
jgi:hypothetical protein